MNRFNCLFRSLFVFVTLLTVLSSCQKEYFDDFEDGDGLVDQADDFLNDEGGEGEEGALTLYRINGSQISKIKDYDVKKKYQSFQEDVTKHQAMWDYFTELIPRSARTKIVEFEVFHGEGDVLGYVSPIDEADLSKWRMGLAIDVVGDLNSINLKTEFAYTAIHEVGHVLTLDDTQIDVGTGIGACGAFHIDEGCSNPNSYINKIYTLGWADIMDEFNSLEYEDETYDFYLKYQDRFVTEYAASNPAEDVAEVFAVFVTADQAPRGNSIADQKVRSMYERPELVKLRDEIRQSSVVKSMKAGSWKRPKCKHHHNHTHKHKKVKAHSF